MVLAAGILGVGAVLAMVTARSRFYDAWFARFGGPDRRERAELVLRETREYMELLRNAPYTVKSFFTAVPDPEVEWRRKQVLISFAAFPAMFILVAVLATLDLRPEPILPAVVALALVGILFGLVLFPVPRRESDEA